MAKKRRKLITNIDQWVLVCEDDARRHSEDNFTAKDLATRNLHSLDPEILFTWQLAAPGAKLADKMRLRKDEYGARMNGSFQITDPDSGRSRWIWKPFDAMNSEQIRTAFQTLVNSMVADVQSLIATEEKCNDLLKSRGAKLLNPEWREVVKARLDGLDEEGEAVA